MEMASPLLESFREPPNNERPMQQILPERTPPAVENQDKQANL